MNAHEWSDREGKFTARDEGLFYLPWGDKEEIALLVNRSPVNAEILRLAARVRELEGWEKVARRQAADMQDDAREDTDNRARIAALEEENRRLRAALNPRTWTQEMHDAWNRAIPDVQGAFDALRSTTPPVSAA